MLKWLSKRLGYRWSLYVLRNQRELIYAMHSMSATDLTYIIGEYVKYGNPVHPYSIGLNFNITNFKL